MGTFADMHLQTRIGETSPAQRVVARNVWIAFCRETRDRNDPRRLAYELVVGRHLKFGAPDRQHHTPHFGVTETLLRPLNIEISNKLDDQILPLCAAGMTEPHFPHATHDLPNT